ncbi:substrate-binding domain-containing protein [Achromobacter pestifer]|uniref:Alkaline phosphatase L n=1 Tax=Achromobacter pestifer TaxID=1353889 RepID=A0A6S6ZZN7_9BURK|nr:substrate-binding domain-containing protein [Achromobacter pestifer]CAB3647121.1 Alkaline phosphatase L [Achromobacter pestifer]
MKTIRKFLLTLSCATLGATSMASAQSMVGGGALPPKGWFDEVGATLPSPWSYTFVGSAAGKRAFIENEPSIHGLVDENDPARNPWPSTQTVHFAGTQIPLTQAELALYAPNEIQWGPLIQVPVALVPVFLPFNRPGVGEMQLSVAQVCRIFSYQPGYRTWGQLFGTADIAPISIVYRQESAETTALLTEYLAEQCDGYLPAGYAFTRSPNFEQAVQSALPADSVGMPVSWVATLGPEALLDALAAGSNHMAYVRADEWPDDQPDFNQFASISGYLATPVNVTSAQPVPPTLPSELSEPANWAPLHDLSAPGYQLYGRAYLLVNQCYLAPGVEGEVKEFLQKLINPAGQLPDNLVALPAAWRAAITNALLDSASGYALDIGNPDVCTAGGRP